ncbi:DUF6397 family protein [Streptomyces sp. NPDC002764]|uniref:DUF6397 family protein n=1 Tax=Streptomyces sp. NPDC002764 TaxID=3154428 RepID=UPI00331E8684
MSGNIVTPSSRTTRTTRTTCTPSRAARELGLKRGEFDLAVHLGHIRTVPDEGGGGRRVPRAEVDRLCAGEGFPETLRKRVETVGTREGAGLLDVSVGRFTRLARLGVVVPVKFYLNRYRAVVWLYLAEELQQFAADENNASLLSGRTPPGLREQLKEGLDVRARNWRVRHLGFLRRQSAGHPWAQAAAVASLLDPARLAEIVPDPYERTHLSRFLPKPMAYGAPDSPTAQVAERILRAADPDEIAWYRADLEQAVSDARAAQPAPRPAPASAPALGTTRPQRPPAAPGAPHQHPPSVERRRPRGLLGRLCRRNA